jgi:hypothetical protein
MSHNLGHLLNTLGFTATASACAPLGCKGVDPLNPLHACQPTGTWTPTPITGT